MLITVETAPGGGRGCAEIADNLPEASLTGRTRSKEENPLGCKIQALSSHALESKLATRTETKYHFELK